jgi:uncharacterized protein (UPF0332 family)
MSIDRLIKQGSIHPFTATREEVDRVLNIARRDLTVAQEIIKETPDWLYSIAYNAVLQGCKAYMFHSGYRPAAMETHKATFEFMHIVVEEPLKQTISYFDRSRRKRHRTIYDEPGLISEKEANELIKKASEFLAYIENKLQE